MIFDVVVIGGGLAGMRAAIAAGKSARVALLSKVYPTRSHSGAAQGGLNAAIKEGDSWESHMFDTVKGSDFLADQDAVELFCKEAPQAMYDIDHMGVVLNRTEEGTLKQTFTGGASFPRNCFGGDLAGHKILHTVYEQLLKSQVTVFNEFSVFKLIVKDNVYRGVVVYDLQRGHFDLIRSKSAIIATGGYGQVYYRTTTDAINTGDGMALALREGAKLQDMEFVQFHPTTLIGTNHLISETVRGDGGHLLNDKGERFMKKYVPTKMELAPRDIVSRSIQTEISKGLGINGEDHVYLDVSHLHKSGKFDLTVRFPQIFATAKKFAGVDFREAPLPIQPAQHYTMGGIKTDVNGHTSIKGLFAAGECACVSIHGANRLGGNSLMETLVFGKRAGIAASEFANNTLIPTLNASDELPSAKDRIQSIFKQVGNENSAKIKDKLRQTMTNLVGIYRNGQDMQQALNIIDELKTRAIQVEIKDKSNLFNTDLIRFLELEYLLELAETITCGAIKRTESRGSHCRKDYPSRDDENFLKHSVIVKNKSGELKIHYEPVSITSISPVERKY